MGFRVEDPDVPSMKEEKKLVRIYKPLPMLPREEAMRMRRATRNAADSLAPWALQELAELAQGCDDASVKHKILMDILKLSLSGKSNEELDPDSPTVDGTLVNKAIADLEKETEKSGDGAE